MTIEQFNSLRNPMYTKQMPGYASETLLLYVLDALGKDYGYGRLAQVVTEMDAIKNHREWTSRLKE